MWQFADWRFADHIFVRICDLRTGTPGNFAICNLRIKRYKFADLRFADWHTSETCGFAIANLRICGQTNKFACPPLIILHIVIWIHNFGRL
jgi:hypothetical protein